MKQYLLFFFLFCSMTAHGMFLEKSPRSPEQSPRSPASPKQSPKTPRAQEIFTIDKKDKVIENFIISQLLGEHQIRKSKCLSPKSRTQSIRVLKTLKELKEINKEYALGIQRLLQKNSFFQKLINALAKEQDIEIEQKGLYLFVKGKEANYHINFVQKKNIPYLITGYFLAKITKEEKLKKRFENMLEKKILLMKSSEEFSYCIQLSKKYNCYSDLKFLFMTNTTTIRFV